MAFIHSYFVANFVHTCTKLLHESDSQTKVTIYDVQKCQQISREPMPKCKIIQIKTKKAKHMHKTFRIHLNMVSRLEQKKN